MFEIRRVYHGLPVCQAEKQISRKSLSVIYLRRLPGTLNSLTTDYPDYQQRRSGGTVVVIGYLWPPIGSRWRAGKRNRRKCLCGKGLGQTGQPHSSQTLICQ